MFRLSVLHGLELSFSSVYVVQPTTHWGKGKHTVGPSCPVQMAAGTQRGPLPGCIPCVGNTRACSHSRVPAWFFKSWFCRKLAFVVCRFFLFNVSCFAAPLGELGFLMRKTCVRASELPASTSVLRELGHKL